MHNLRLTNVDISACTVLHGRPTRAAFVQLGDGAKSVGNVAMMKLTAHHLFENCPLRYLVIFVHLHSTQKVTVI